MKTFTRSCPSFRSSKHMAERKVSRLLIGVASYVQSWCNLGLTGLWMSHCPPQSLNFFIQGLSSIESKPVRYPVLLDRNKDLVSLILAEAKRENHMPKCLGPSVECTLCQEAVAPAKPAPPLSSSSNPATANPSFLTMSASSSTRSTRNSRLPATGLLIW